MLHLSNEFLKLMYNASDNRIHEEDTNLSQDDFFSVGNYLSRRGLCTPLFVDQPNASFLMLTNKGKRFVETHPTILK